jgi:uncharacterized protein (DUF1800 family)
MRIHYRLRYLGLCLALAITSSLNAQTVMAGHGLSQAQARHFLLRTGFAPTQAQVDQITGQSAEQVVTATLTQARASRVNQPNPAFVSAPPPTPLALLKTQEERQAARQQQLREGMVLKTWWMREMVETTTPLQERMVLFWHNHFATSQQKVVRAQAMWAQHQLLRSQALGNFSTLLHAVAKDPAMLVYLDGANSRKEAPNENFAREVMELFTLGEATQGGGYSEQDIREAARAFTGWSIEREDFSFKFRPLFHDRGTKTVMGRSGNFDGDGVLDVMLAQPAAARFIVSKLWREFVSATPDANEVRRIAELFQRSGYDIPTALKALLLSDAFWSPVNRGGLIKSPVELVVGTVRQFGFDASAPLPLVVKTAQLGQNLLMPPNVKGWPGYTDWINATTLLERKRFAEQIFRSNERQSESTMAPVAMEPSRLAPNGPQMQVMMQRIRFDADRWLTAYGAHADREPGADEKKRIEAAVLAAPATQTIAAGTVGVAYLRSLALDPAYQLK